MINKQAFTYILASQQNSTLYTGVTSNLNKRIYEHKSKEHKESFTAKYNVTKLVWYVVDDDISAAIALEKKIKNRNRAWKIALIEKTNPTWKDLSLDFTNTHLSSDNTHIPFTVIPPPLSMVIPHAVAESSEQTGQSGSNDIIMDSATSCRMTGENGE